MRAWEWGMSGSQMCAHARGCASAQSLHTWMCICVPEMCMGPSCHLSLQVYRCACSGHTACVYLFRARFCPQVCPVHGT